MRTRTDDSSLLCEECGYALDGLPATGECPECGRAIAASLPDARAGSAWQRGPGFRGWRVTASEVLRHPRTTMSAIRFEPERCVALFHINAGIASFLLILPAPIAAAAAFLSDTNYPNDPFPVAIPAILGSIGIAFALWPIGIFGLWLLTGIEELGIRFIGRRRGWRMTREVARAVCAHASFGWIVGALLWDMGIAASYAATDGLRRSIPAWLPALPMLGFFAGLLVFEVLVYIGSRRCRFVNRSREAGAPAPRRSAEPASPSA